MSQIKEDIIKNIQNKIIKCIEFGEKNLKVSLLILHVTYSFSNRYSVSYVQSKFLEYDMFLSLHSLEKLKQSGGKELFEEYHKKVKNFKGTESFIGDWHQHCNALISHEMAHVFETMAQYEPFTFSQINQYYNHTPKRNIHHHNLLWKKIYRDLKCCENSNNSVVIISNQFGFDCYYKGKYL